MNDQNIELSETSESSTAVTETTVGNSDNYVNLEAVNDGNQSGKSEGKRGGVITDENLIDVDLNERNDPSVAVQGKTMDAKKKKLTLKEALKKALLPEKGKYFSYIFGIAFDSIGLFIWLMIVIFVVPPEESQKYWFMPLVGILGATFAMATPAGGGVFYFPFLTLYGHTAATAVAFNIATASVSMGIFGSASWIRKSRRSIIVWLVVVTTISGWIGTLFSIFLPIENSLILRIIFLVFSFFLLCYIIYILWKKKVKSQSAAIGDYKNPKILIPVIITGLLGGVIVGYIGVGIDMMIFLVTTLFYNVDTRKATGSSILIMGWTAAFPFFFHLFYLKNVPLELWAMVLGGCIIGARLGVLINKLFGRRRMMILFAVLLLAEVIRTPIELAISAPS